MRDNRKKNKFRYYGRIEQVGALSPSQRAQLAEVVQTYRFYANDYYLSLIDWDDPQDPIRRLIIPDGRELEKWGNLDPSGEANFTVIQGLEHKYPSTVLLLVSNTCGGICRYCFRKRFFIHSHGQILSDLPAAVRYIQEHTEITNVLLTGGDPLALSTPKLKKVIDALLPIEHIKIIRIGSKMPAFNPFRITEDHRLPELIAQCNDCGKQIYIMTHFDHPRELTQAARQAVICLQQVRARLANQTPIIRGINDHPDVLAELFRQLSFAGITPYYVFQCRPASGNKYLAVPIEEGHRIFEQARSRVSGLGKQARFVMSHITGKIEIVAVEDDYVYMKYHRSSEETLNSKFILCKRNPNAYWFDDYQEIIETQPESVHYRAYGPE